MAVDGIGCIDGALAATIQGTSDFQAPIHQSTLYRFQKAFARLVGDGDAALEEPFGGHRLVAAFAADGVEPGGLDMVARPAAGCAVTSSEGLGVELDGAVSRLAGAVVAGEVGRREQRGDAVSLEEGREMSLGEVFAVVGLEYEWCAEGEDQGGEDEDGGGGVRAFARHRGEDASRSEIADVEQPGMGAIDGVVWFGVVGGPDRVDGRPDADLGETGTRRPVIKDIRILTKLILHGIFGHDAFPIRSHSRLQ